MIRLSLPQQAPMQESSQTIWEYEQCKAIDGCVVDGPDAVCEHGHPACFLQRAIVRRDGK